MASLTLPVYFCGAIPGGVVTAHVNEGSTFALQGGPPMLARRFCVVHPQAATFDGLEIKARGLTIFKWQRTLDHDSGEWSSLASQIDRTRIVVPMGGSAVHLLNLTEAAPLFVILGVSRFAIEGTRIEAWFDLA